MYTREQASQLRQAFWTVFGQYIAPQPSAEGLKINWINYDTGYKNVNFRMNADKSKATIAIELTHPDAEIQAYFFEQFVALKKVLKGYMQEEWEWRLHATGEDNKIISKIYKEISPVNVFDRDDWPKIISFLKPRIVALDEFWSDAKYTFEELR